MITAERLREVLSYDKESGLFFWRGKTCRKVVVGKMAGALCSGGYIRIRIDGILYAAHRLAWLYEYGAFPEKHIDHINRDRTDNRILNLRQCVDFENGQNRDKGKNNTSGHLGVSKRNGRWVAQIMFKRKQIHLGVYDRIEDAIEARIEGEKKYQKFKQGAN